MPAQARSVRRSGGARTSGRRPPASVERRLADLDDVAVGVADVGADLGLVDLRLGEEFGAAGAPLLVDGGDVLDADVEEAADPVGVGGRLQGDGRLVVGRPAAFVD